MVESVNLDIEDTPETIQVNIKMGESFSIGIQHNPETFSVNIVQAGN